MENKVKSAYLIFIDDSKFGIDSRTLRHLEDVVVNREAEQLYLVIQSRGGDPHSAVAIMNVLDKSFSKISTIIPRYAKSSATLMALGTDEIYMNSGSALGPLDLQIEHHRDGSRISALDVNNTTASMFDLSEKYADSIYYILRDREISALEASRLSLHSTTELLEPIIRQVDPYHLQKAQRNLLIGYHYAVKLLMRRMMKGKRSIAEQTAKDLVHSFPAHEYCIFPDDAEHRLNLKIKELKNFLEWETVIKPQYALVSDRPYYIDYGIIEEDKNKNAGDTKKQRTRK